MQRVSAVNRLRRVAFTLFGAGPILEGPLAIIVSHNYIPPRWHSLWQDKTTIMAARQLWPQLTHPSPVDATEHLAVLDHDFDAVHDYLETNPQRMVPRPIFDQLYQSSKELKRKLDTQQASRPELRARRPKKRRVAQDSSNSQALGDAASSTLIDPHADSSNADGSSEMKSSFKVSLKDPRVIRLIREMETSELRKLVNRACTQDPNIKIALGGNQSSSDVTLNATGELVGSCPTWEERSRLLTHKNWHTSFDSFIDGEFPVYGVLWDSFVQKVAKDERDTWSDASAEQLLASNIALMSTLRDVSDIKMVIRIPNSEKGKPAHILAQFARPEQANEAITKGLVWNNRLHTCIRDVRDREIEQCGKCGCYDTCGVRHCKRNSVCRICYGPHATKECSATRPPCVLCTHQHRLGGKLCKIKAQELKDAKEKARVRQPFFEVASTRNPASPTAAQFGNVESQDTDSPNAARRSSRVEGIRPDVTTSRKNQFSKALSSRLETTNVLHQMEQMLELQMPDTIMTTTRDAEHGTLPTFPSLKLLNYQFANRLHDHGNHSLAKSEGQGNRHLYRKQRDSLIAPNVIDIQIPYMMRYKEMIQPLRGTPTPREQVLSNKENRLGAVTQERRPFTAANGVHRVRCIMTGGSIPTGTHLPKTAARVS